MPLGPKVRKPPGGGAFAHDERNFVGGDWFTSVPVQREFAGTSLFCGHLRRFLKNLPDVPVETDALPHGGQGQLSVKFGADTDVEAPF